MIIVYGVILLLIFGLFLLTAGQRCDKKGILKPFWKAGIWMCGLIGEHAEGRKRSLEQMMPGGARIAADIKALYPTDDVDEKMKFFYAEKFVWMLLALFILSAAAFGYEIVGRRVQILMDGGYIIRNEPGEGDIGLTLEAAYEDDYQDEIMLTVPERMYSEEELAELFEKAQNKLAVQLLNKNESLECIKSSLALPSSVPGFPFAIRWDVGNSGLIEEDGEILNLGLEESGRVEELRAEFSCRDFMKEAVYLLHIFPKEENERELRKRLLLEKIGREEEKSAEANGFRLPVTVDGKTIVWKQKKEYTGVSLMLAGCICAVVFYVMKDYDLHKNVEKRRKELVNTYPEIVNRIALYTGAGMTVRNAWIKTAYDYKQRKEQGGRYRFAYEEMLVTCHELESGISEEAAYQRFGKRCAVKQYMKFGTLLSQNLMKGNSAMLKQLRQEADAAFLDRLNSARILGEEAGTKLLFPMMLLFGMVLLLIMIPAFGTFIL